jgi:transcriptional regulator with XRE-family HTH domain
MSEALGIDRIQISRLEKRKDPRLSTLQRMAAVMGNHLTLIALFASQEPVVFVT